MQSLSIPTISPKGSTSEVVKRLKALHLELAAFEQGQVDTESLATVKSDLINHSFLLHKDRTVKAYVACCLADLLKLYAPDAPYSEQELQDIFQFIFRQLKNLGKKTADHNGEQYRYLLDSLSNAKSACLVCELPSADEQIMDVFRDFFDAIDLDSPKPVHIAMGDILAQFVDESQTLPQDVIETLLAQFRPQSIKLRPAAYKLAVEVCRTSSDRLQRHICQYFTDIFANAEKELAEDNVALEDVTDLLTAHELIQELDRTVPAVLLNVIPQLEEELKVDNVELRSLAVKTLGAMFAGHSGTLDHLAKRYPSTWKAWLTRAKDKIAAVRIVVLEALNSIWTAHGELAKDVQETIRAKLVDPDDKVRTAACASLGQADLETLIHNVDITLLQELAERIRDKKRLVAVEALRSICKLYDTAYPEIESGESAVLNHFAWIPSHVLESYGATDRFIQAQIECNFLDFILPLPARVEEDVLWVDRFLAVMSLLSEKASVVLWRLTHLGDRFPSLYGKYIEACMEYNSGIIDDGEESVTSNLNKIIKFLAALFPDPVKAAEDFRKFAKMNESRLYRLLQTLMDPQIDLKTLIKTYPEFIRRLEQSSAALSATFSLLARRCALLFINRTSIGPLLSKVASADTIAHGSSALGALTKIAELRPALYKEHWPVLVALLDSEAGSEGKETALLAMSQYARAESSAVEVDEALRNACRKILSVGTGSQPKSAATLLCLACTGAEDINDLVDDLVTALPKSKGTRLVAHLSALNRFAKLKPQALHHHDATLSRYVTDLLSQANDSMPADDAEETEWAEDANLDEHTKAMIYAIKILVNRCLDETQTADILSSLVETVMKLADSLLQMDEPSLHSTATQARLRLQMACSLLKLATNARLQTAVLKRLAELLWTVQDPAYVVRHRLIKKICKYLLQRRLTDPRFGLGLFLVAHDPERENTETARINIIGRLNQARLPDIRMREFEMPFVRLLHLLAHHPDFSRAPEDVAVFAKYIQFYLDCIARSENIDLLHHLSLKMRSVRDAVSQGHSENLYTLAELSQFLISNLSQSKGWTLNSYPGHVKMPSDIFKPLPSKEVQADIAKKTWLNAGSLEAVKTALKTGSAARTTAKNKPEKKKAVPRKRKSSTTNSKKAPAKRMRNNSSGKRKKRQEWEGDESEEESEAKSDEDEDDMTSGGKHQHTRAEESNVRRSGRTKKSGQKVESELSELSDSV